MSGPRRLGRGALVAACSSSPPVVDGADALARAGSTCAASGFARAASLHDHAASACAHAAEAEPTGANEAVATGAAEPDAPRAKRVTRETRAVATRPGGGAVTFLQATARRHARRARRGS